jgi:hypothetical protein
MGLGSKTNGVAKCLAPGASNQNGCHEENYKCYFVSFRRQCVVIELIKFVDFFCSVTYLELVVIVLILIHEMIKKVTELVVQKLQHLSKNIFIGVFFHLA